MTCCDVTRDARREGSCRRRRRCRRCRCRRRRCRRRRCRWRCSLCLTGQSEVVEIQLRREKAFLRVLLKAML